MSVHRYQRGGRGGARSLSPYEFMIMIFYLRFFVMFVHTCFDFNFFSPPAQAVLAQEVIQVEQVHLGRSGLLVSTLLLMVQTTRLLFVSFFS